MSREMTREYKNIPSFKYDLFERVFYPQSTIIISQTIFLPRVFFAILHKCLVTLCY